MAMGRLADVVDGMDTVDSTRQILSALAKSAFYGLALAMWLVCALLGYAVLLCPFLTD